MAIKRKLRFDQSKRVKLKLVFFSCSKYIVYSENYYLLDLSFCYILNFLFVIIHL